MHHRPFQQVDVFTATPYRGNPLAVVLDSAGLDTEAMQHFTNWTNLSECTFVLPPTPEGRAAGADYRVRIFCPGRELPFAGHPTLGTAHAWLATGAQARGANIVQECGVGLVAIRRDGDRLAFAAPPLRRSGPLDEADVTLIARGLGVARSEIVAHSWCDNGPGWRAVMLPNAERVLALQPDASVLAGLDIGVVGRWGKLGSGKLGSDSNSFDAPGGKPTGPKELESDPNFPHRPLFEVRAFFPGNNGLTEDPVTGSLNAALAQWLIGSGMAPPRFVAAQGTALQRAGRVHIDRDDDGTVWVGGHAVTCVAGTVLL